MAGQPRVDDFLYPPFDGFPRAGIEFLRKLKRNNNRPWFQAHRSEYDEFVHFPMECLVADLRARMADIAPEFEFHPKRSIFRVYRDTRFSNDKTPYKTNIAASFAIRGRKGPTGSPGLYLGIEPGEIWAGGGLYLPSGDQLKAIREAIVRKPEEWLEIVGNRRFKREYGGIDGEKLRTAPQGYPRDHPLIEHLRHKQFYAGKEIPLSACFTKEFPVIVGRVLTDILPLIRWLARVV